MKNNKFDGNSLVTIILIISIILLIVSGIKINKLNNFFKFNIIDISNLLLTGLIATYIASSQTRSAKRKENLENIIEKFQSNFYDAISSLSSNDKELQKTKILMFMRKTSNQFEIIKKYSKNYKIDENINALDQKLNDYQTILSDHINKDLTTFSNELSRASESINNICENIKFEIYL